MNQDRLETSLYAGLLFTLLGGIAWLTGEPFIFPSLGPSAFILAVERSGDRTRTYRVVGSHLIGAVAGLLAYSLLATGISLSASPPPAGSVEGLRLALSGVVSIVLTAWGMLATNTVHAPACATTLIVSLGVLSTVVQTLVIVVSIALVVGFHRTVLWGFKRMDGNTQHGHSED